MIYVDIGVNVVNVIFKHYIIEFSIDCIVTLINKNFPSQVTYKLNDRYVTLGDVIHIIQPTTGEYYNGTITCIDNNLITIHVSACPIWNSVNMMDKECIFDMRYFHEFNKSYAYLIAG